MHDDEDIPNWQFWTEVMSELAKPHTTPERVEVPNVEWHPTAYSVGGEVVRGTVIIKRV